MAAPTRKPRAGGWVTGGDVSRAFESVKKTIQLSTLEALTDIGVSILDKSLHEDPAAPYDTGRLRESSNVMIEVGGRGSVVADCISINGEIREDRGGLRRLAGEKGAIRMTVAYDDDIALWAHDDLKHYNERLTPPHPSKPGVSPPEKDEYFARHPNTGPKYLETHFRELEGNMKAVIENKIAISLNVDFGKSKHKMGGVL